jgi:hypothetical protein
MEEWRSEGKWEGSERTPRIGRLYRARTYAYLDISSDTVRTRRVFLYLYKSKGDLSVKEP